MISAELIQRRSSDAIAKANSLLAVRAPALPAYTVSSLHRHYTYILIAADAEDLHQAGLPWLYIGVRSSHGPVDSDPYMGSSDYVAAAMRAGLSFDKQIIRTHLTRKRANKDEKSLLETFKYQQSGEMWDWLYNRVVPGEFGPFSRAGAVFKAIVAKKTRPALTAAKLAHLKSIAANGKGGTIPGTRLFEDHKRAISDSVKLFWRDVAEYSAAKGIKRPSLGKIDRADFEAWKQSNMKSNQGVLQ